MGAAGVQTADALSKVFYRANQLFGEMLECQRTGEPWPDWKDDRLRSWLHIAMREAKDFRGRAAKDLSNGKPTLQGIAARAQSSSQPAIPVESRPVNGEESGE